MSKTDFWILAFCNFISVVILVEYLCGLELALECLIGWVFISLLVHIRVFSKFKIIHYEFVHEDLTK